MRYKDIEFVGIVYNNYYFRVGILLSVGDKGEHASRSA